MINKLINQLFKTNNSNITCRYMYVIYIISKISHTLYYYIIIKQGFKLFHF